MLNYVWMFLMIVGIAVSVVSGRTEEIMDTIIESANNAVTFSIGLIGVVALWCGVIKILEDAGAVEWLSKKLKPVVTRIFPSTKNNPKAQNAIVTNITANFLGLGNGATPSGIEAVAEMKENVRDVCLFLVINSAGIQLIPSTVIAIRAELGAANPTDIILPTWIVSVISLIAAVAIYAVCSSFCRDRRHTK
ncbi:MAG: hypothetical protein J6C24_04530 [Clostridia bacterium]|nr:hypothetical protein [Clostridia bacterium]